MCEIATGHRHRLQTESAISALHQSPRIPQAALGDASDDTSAVAPDLVSPLSYSCAVTVMAAQPPSPASSQPEDGPHAAVEEAAGLTWSQQVQRASGPPAVLPAVLPARSESDDENLLSLIAGLHVETAGVGRSLLLGA